VLEADQLGVDWLTEQPEPRIDFVERRSSDHVYCTRTNAYSIKSDVNDLIAASEGNSHLVGRHVRITVRVLSYRVRDMGRRLSPRLAENGSEPTEDLANRVDGSPRMRTPHHLCRSSPLTKHGWRRPLSPPSFAAQPSHLLAADHVHSRHCRPGHPLPLRR
jgi:hypothetical protein